MNKLIKFCGLAALAVVFLKANGAAEGLEVQLTGGDWDLGNIYQNQVFSTTGNRWSIVSASDGSEDIYAKVAEDGAHWAPSADGTNGQDKYVLRLGSSSGTILGGTDTYLSWLPQSSTYSLDLWFKAPDQTSINTGVHNLTVTLTAKNWETPIALNEVQVIDANVIKIGTGGGHWLMWPRAQSSLATNNNGDLAWQDNNTAGQPAWNFATKTYDYTAGGGPGGACTSHCTKANYPAFSWAEDLNWDGYTDWRLPTKDELVQLYAYRSTYVPTTKYYWSASEYSAAIAYAVSFLDGIVYSNSNKPFTISVRAVRGSR